MKKLLALFLIVSVFSCGKSPCVKHTCKDFKTQKEAQKVYDSDRNCYKNLDRDGDGKACEDLPEK
jgi:hypothetical protein